MTVTIFGSNGAKEIINVPYAKPSDLPAPENRKITNINNDKLVQSINALSYLARRFNIV